MSEEIFKPVVIAFHNKKPVVLHYNKLFAAKHWDNNTVVYCADRSTINNGFWIDLENDDGSGFPGDHVYEPYQSTRISPFDWESMARFIGLPTNRSMVVETNDSDCWKGYRSHYAEGSEALLSAFASMCYIYSVCKPIPSGNSRDMSDTSSSITVSDLISLGDNKTYTLSNGEEAVLYRPHPKHAHLVLPTPSIARI